MTAKATLRLPGDVRIVVPDAPDLITPYVLAEQEDWFEDEIKFLRRLLAPGQSAIDIGANYGVYALSMARAVGPRGHVWAFEPAAGTAALLAESIAANEFGQLTLERSAVAAASGSGRLSRNANTELNALVAPDAAGGEEVPVVTLDACLDKYGWQSIDVLKIDAEGAEAEILKGGERFFSALSPLVLYEVKAGSVLHLDLVRAFAALGYDSYRLVPGLDLLVPFDPEARADGFLLNLFCCKPDCAARLEERGYLLRSPAPPPRDAGLEDYHWTRCLAPLPYGARLAGAWERTVVAGKSADVQEALALYALSRDTARSPSERFGALEGALNRLWAVCERDPAYLRPASLARVASDFGARSLACMALQALGDMMLQGKAVDCDEPFLAPGARFDAIAPGKDLGDWVLAAVLEELERLGSLSSFYTGPAALPRLETIHRLGFGSAEMARRLKMVRQRGGAAP